MRHTEPKRRKFLFLAAGVLASVMWFSWSAITLIPGSTGDELYWAVSNALALLAGAAFGAAAVTR